jgi:D-alanyl-D-alanine carboxypeptidase/D-alanyl-D-alanine-endopeptidase (penicillin-binding protein 4)
MNTSCRFKDWLKCSLAVLVAVIVTSGCEVPSGAGRGITAVHVYTAPVPVGTDVLIQRHDLSGVHVGYVLYDLKTGAKLAGRNGNQPFIPASTAKVPTTVAALNVLGPDYRFETRLLATGDIVGGVINGNLYLQGGADPLLQPQDLMALAQQLKDAGISGLSGRFFYDTSFLRETNRIDAEQPANARYNPGVDALSLDFNQTLLTWRRKDQAGTVESFETPVFDETGPGLAASDPGPGRDIIYAGPAGPGRWLLSPTAPVEGSAYLPVKEPGLRTARVFRRLASMIGVELPDPEAAVAPPGIRVVGGVGSLPLVDIVRQSLEHSNNVVAELIGQVAGRRLAGKPGTLAETSRALTGWLKSRLPTITWDGFALPNHSGLSAAARVTPEQMAAIIRFAVDQRYGGWSYAALLPASGMRDAMRGRLRDPTTALRVWGKTGTLKYAKGLTGILFTQQGRQVAFALFIADFEKRRAYDAADNVEAPEVAAQADAWIRQVEALEEAIVREWIIQF